MGITGQYLLSSSISKIFEKVAFKQISEYFTCNNLLFNSQYGFRENHSTELAALEFVDRIKLEMDRKKIPFSIFLDLSKALNTLNHDILLTKLRYYGIEGVALNWFQSYLTKRTQYVQYNDTSSSIREIETGVPQGSILGPLLFIIYMNDFHTVSQKFTFILYADDTTLISPLCWFIHRSQSDMDYVSTMINMELSEISDWLAVNKLSLNTAKIKFMLFHSYQKTINEDDIPHLTINDTIIQRATEFNFLGAHNKRIHELEFSCIKNIQQDISHTGCNEQTETLFSPFSHKTNVLLLNLISFAICYHLLGVGKGKIF